MIVTDVAIVGAGPAGLFSIFQCGMLGLRTVVIDALDVVGGQCSALYPEKPIFDIPAFERIEAAELVQRLERQASPFQPDYRLGERVEDLSLVPDSSDWLLRTDRGTKVVARAVILAVGAGAFAPNRPDLPELGAYEDSGCVSYVVRKRSEYSGRRVVIVGGGDSAVDWAISLADVATHVSVVHRRDRFRSAPDSERQLRALAADGGRLALHVPYQLDGLTGFEGRLSGVTVRHVTNGEVRVIEADVLLPFFGLDAALGPVAEWGLDLVDKRLVATEQATCATSLPGIFAVGDVAGYPGKHKLILTAFAEAAAAAQSVHAVARPGAILRFQHSTSRGLPSADGHDDRLPQVSVGRR
jgi:thioredoxin reductase (NADPH)